MQDLADWHHIKCNLCCRHKMYAASRRHYKKDEFGIWKYSGSHPQAYKVYYEEDDISVEKCGSNERCNNVVHLRRLHCTHPSNPQFKRLICFVSGKLFGQKGMKVQYCRYMLT